MSGKLLWDRGSGVTSCAKVLFIGIDAADKDLIQAWTQEGSLPTFNELLQHGAWSIVENPPGLYVGAVWPSFYTGLKPTRHQRYCYEQLGPGSYENYHFDPKKDIRGVPFWVALSLAGKRVAAIDIPKAPLTTGINGIHVIDWGTHDAEKAGLTTWPDALRQDLVSRFGTDQIGSCNAVRTKADDYLYFRDTLIERVRKKAAMTSYLLKQGPWDCLLTAFTESHCIGHQCWHLHDPNHPRHDPELVRKTGDPMKDVYQAIDREIGKFLIEVGRDTNVIVLASHGMGPHYEATFMLEDILTRLDNYSPPKAYPRLTRTLEWVWGKLPMVMRRGLKPASEQVKARVDPRTRRLSTRKCFKIPNNDVYGGIRVNLRGREPAGRIAPGKEYEEFCSVLTRDLLELVNVDTGNPLVTAVHRASELYPGEDIGHLPDLFVEWDRTRPITHIYSPKIGHLEKQYHGVRTGDHKAEGLFFAIGPSFHGGQLRDQVSVTDFAPTIAELLNVELSQVDGKSFLPLLATADALQAR